MPKVSKELLDFKKIIEKDEITYENQNMEELNVDFLIDYVYENECFLDDTRHQGYTLHSLEEILLIVIFALLSNSNTYKEIELITHFHYEWQIENNLHWYLDTVFKENSNKSYIENSQKNLNIIRKFCLGIIKQAKPIYNHSVNSIRQILSMKYEEEIERIFHSLY